MPLTVAAMAGAYQLQPGLRGLSRHLRRHATLSLTLRIDGREVTLRLKRSQAANLAGAIMRRLRRVAPRHHPRPLPVNGDTYRRRRRQATRRRQ